MLAKAWPPFPAQVDITIDHDTVNGLADYPQQSYNTRQFAPEELARPVIIGHRTFNHPFGSGLCITPVTEQDAGNPGAAFTVINIDCQDHGSHKA
jgi:hypothetical protein